VNCVDATRWVDGFSTDFLARHLSTPLEAKRVGDIVKAGNI